ncbi:16S rRNA (guanine(966)-N(2))-methyltransferase RsmD [Methylothermus subterraneus]
MRNKNEVRILAGALKGQRLPFPRVASLRPTPGLVRETLFNWLREDVAGANCLDLFAGSGALGFEAASRGASSVVLVESHPQAVKRLFENRARLAASQVEIVGSEVVRFLKQALAEPFDLVFLDPPYGQGLVEVCCRLLEERGWLKPAAKIYVEAESRFAPPVPSRWEKLREKRVGEVGCRLYVRAK